MSAIVGVKKLDHGGIGQPRRLSAGRKQARLRSELAESGDAGGPVGVEVSQDDCGDIRNAESDTLKPFGKQLDVEGGARVGEGERTGSEHVAAGVAQCQKVEAGMKETTRSNQHPNSSKSTCVDCPKT